MAIFIVKGITSNCYLKKGWNTSRFYRFFPLGKRSLKGLHVDLEETLLKCEGNTDSQNEKR
jgi:hypothetical protein